MVRSGLSSGWLPGLERLPSYWGDTDVRFAPLFDAPPDLLVIHSGDRGNWVAEFLSNPRCLPPKGRICPDRARRFVAAAHLCWYAGNARWLRRGVRPPAIRDAFVQCASLHRSVPGAGGSICQGRGWVNTRAIHVELPAAPSDPVAVRALFAALLGQLLPACPGLRWWTEHRLIDREKRDPVPGTGFSAEWMGGSGLVRAGRDRGDPTAPDPNR